MRCGSSSSTLVLKSNLQQTICLATPVEAMEATEDALVETTVAVAVAVVVTLAVALQRVCGKYGHDALRCYHCFNHSYQSEEVRSAVAANLAPRGTKMPRPAPKGMEIPRLALRLWKYRHLAPRAQNYPHLTHKGVDSLLKKVLFV